MKMIWLPVHLCVHELTLKPIDSILFVFNLVISRREKRVSIQLRDIRSMSILFPTPALFIIFKYSSSVDSWRIHLLLTKQQKLIHDQ